MTPGLDAGPCLGQQRTPIDPDEDAGALEARLAAMGAELVLKVVEQLATGTITAGRTRRELRASKAPRLEKGARRDRLVAIGSRNQESRARRPALAAGVYVLASQRCTASSAERSTASRPWRRIAGAMSRRIVMEARPELVVSTGETARSKSLEFQPAGKRSMSAGEFLRGNRVRVGDRSWAGIACSRAGKSPSRRVLPARYHKACPRSFGSRRPANRHGVPGLDRWDVALMLARGVRGRDDARAD